MSNELLTTPQAAERLGVSTARIRQLILEGRLPSQQFGRDHLIKEADLSLVAERKPGRPPKPKDEETELLPAETPPIVAAALKAGDVVEALSESKPKAKRTAEKRSTKAKGRK